MTTTRTLTALAVGALILTGCGGTQHDDLVSNGGTATASVAVATPTPTPVTDPTRLATELRTNTPWQNQANTRQTFRATAATCVAQTVRANGAGTYLCQVEFDDYTSGSFVVTVADDGSLVTTHAP
jgi:hypothetical protein